MRCFTSWCCIYCDPLLTTVLFIKQKTVYEMRISDWSSDVCSSDLTGKTLLGGIDGVRQTQAEYQQMVQAKNRAQAAVQNLANSDGSKKRVSAASLLARADSIMQSRDRTTWDDTSKRSVTEAADKYTDNQLDGMVKIGRA